MKQRNFGSFSSLVATATIAMITIRPKFPDDPSFAKVLNGNDGVGDTGGGEILKDGDPGVLAVAAMNQVPSTDQQQQATGAEQQADAGVIEAKGMIVGDDSTAVGDPPGTGTEQVQQA